MRYWMASVLIVLGLATLLVLQYRWLRAGLLLEKQHLDQDYRQALVAVAHRLEQHPQLPRQLGQLHFQPARQQPAFPASIGDSLRQWLTEALQTHRPGSEFSFALYTQTDDDLLLSAPDFDPQQSLLTYRMPLTGSGVVAACHCRTTLHLQARQPIRQLLDELRPLLYSGAAALLLILAGAVLLLAGVVRLQRLDRAKNDFINHLTHELKTPIFSSRLLLRLARDAVQRQQPAQVREHLTLLAAENNRLHEQAERVLELVSIDRPRYPLHLENLDLKALVNEVSRPFIVRAGDAGGRLTLQLPAGPAPVTADATHLAGAIANLLDNALKYQPRPPEVEVCLTPDHGWWQLDVADRGPGIPRRYHRRIFRKFFRLPQTTAGGYGLGLSYVQSVVRAMGGRVRVYNRAGGGMVFRVKLRKGGQVDGWTGGQGIGGQETSGLVDRGTRDRGHS